MKYNGKELTKFKSNNNVAFNPSKDMIVWDDEESKYHETKVLAYAPALGYPVITWTGTRYRFCAEIPKMTNWDIYAKQNGITTSLDTALDVFHQRGPTCIFCPAINFCRHSERSCPLNFEKWATAEYKETK